MNLHIINTLIFSHEILQCSNYKTEIDEIVFAALVRMLS